MMKRIPAPGFRLRAWGAVLGLLLGHGALAQTRACMTEDALRARMRHEGQVEAMRAVEVFVDADKKARWDASTQDYGGQSMSGADVYRMVSFMADRDQLAQLEARMRSSGTPPAAQAKGISELIEYGELIMKDRFLRIKASFQHFYLFRRGDTGVVVTQSDDQACIAWQLRGLTVQHYSLDLPAGWLPAGSKLPRLIEAYRKENRFGVAAFGKTAGGDVIVVLAKPQFGRGDYDGPVPYYFGGVLLQETKSGGASVVADLMHTRYVERHDYNFSR